MKIQKILKNLEFNNNLILSNGEVSIQDIILYIKQSWRIYLVAVLTGIFLGFLYSFFFKTSGYLQILSSNRASSLYITADDWDFLKKEIPTIVEKLNINSELPNNERKIYQMLANPEWWKDNVVVNYKAESVNLINSIEINIHGWRGFETLNTVTQIAKSIINLGLWVESSAVVYNLNQELTLFALNYESKKLKFNDELLEAKSELIFLMGLYKVPSLNIPGKLSLFGMDPNDSNIPLELQIIKKKIYINELANKIKALDDEARLNHEIGKIIVKATKVIDENRGDPMIGARIISVFNDSDFDVARELKSKIIIQNAIRKLNLVIYKYQNLVIQKPTVITKQVSKYIFLGALICLLFTLMVSLFLTLGSNIQINESKKLNNELS
jgi:hypothetical protein